MDDGGTAVPMGSRSTWRGVRACEREGGTWGGREKDREGGNRPALRLGRRSG